ncbi:hypothetical protein M8J76_000878 [Diaphorina citri]|nr:hypothetical protein M8J75_002398 [Diaphorina citri]KAI5748645.1 hypothetical protein M8J76_000878 [Diaphorina citri]
MYPSSQIQRTRNAVALRRGFRRAASMYVGVGTAFAYIPPIPDLADDTEEHDKGFKANITIGQEQNLKCQLYADESELGDVRKC